MSDIDNINSKKIKFSLAFGIAALIILPGYLVNTSVQINYGITGLNPSFFVRIIVILLSYTYLIKIFYFFYRLFLSKYTKLSNLMALMIVFILFSSCMLGLLHPNGFPFTKIQIIVLILLSLCTLFVRSYYYEIFNIFSWFGFALFILFFLKLLPPAIHHTTIYSYNTNKYKQNTTKPRVVWLILDNIQQNNKVNYQFESIKKLSKTSICSDQAFPPSNNTLIEIPSLITGQKLDNLYIKNAWQLKFSSENQQIIYPTAKNNLFSTLNESGLSVAIMGVAHPYCVQYPMLDYCLNPDIRHYTNKTWSKMMAYPFSYLLRKLNLEALFDNWLDKYDPWSAAERKIITSLPEVIKKTYDFTFVHINIPHLPFTNSYTNNFRNIDRLISDLVQTLETQSKDSNRKTFLIISSDKSLLHNASGSFDSTQPSIFIVHNFDDNTSYLLDNRISTIHTRELIEKLFNGEIKTNKEIVNWLKSEEFVPPWFVPYDSLYSNLYH